MGIDNPVHLIFIAAVALIVLGPKRLPDLARSLGHGMKEFRDSMSQGADGVDHTTAPIVPQQAQLVVASDPASAVPVDAVVVDPAAPEGPAVTAVQATQVEQAVPVPAAASETGAQSSPPPAS
jgi:sec-independent protein translocase protein TatA